ncbi:glycosyltransferase [Candidatus Microgenomates bacterium]|nr:MAG: glycosyltransferase [Candidatus Microgenomates bacterium]
MKVSFIIPFHNEEKNAGPMLEQVVAYAKRKKLDYEIVPVDDRSQDLTNAILTAYAKKNQRIKPIKRQLEAEAMGNTMGKALLEGSKKASGEIIIWTMGDRADDVNTYDAIMKKLNEGFDLVFGSRYMPGGTWGSLDPTKAFLSSRGTVLARILFGVPVHDITNAFRGFRKSLLTKITLKSSGFAISPEFAIKAHLRGFKLGEVPTVYYSRTEGVSNFKLWEMSIEYLRVYASLLAQKIFGIIPT